MSVKEKILISACLIGQNVKYNGKNNKLTDLQKLRDRFELIPFCPEVEGGLPTPRLPSEIVSFKPLKLVNSKGQDVTRFFTNGAIKTLNFCKELKIQAAILKSNSPSCGIGKVYDGTFSKTLINGNGVTADLLLKNGIKIISEKNII